MLCWSPTPFGMLLLVAMTMCFPCATEAQEVWQERCGRREARGPVCIARARASEFVACLRSGYLLENAESKFTAMRNLG